MVKLHLSMNKKYYLLWMLVVLLPFLAGCSDDEQPEVAEPYLRVVETTSCENISSAAATLTLKVESNVEWKVVSESHGAQFLLRICGQAMLPLKYKLAKT